MLKFPRLSDDIKASDKFVLGVTMFNQITTFKESEHMILVDENTLV